MAVLSALIGVACSSGNVDLGERGTSFASGGAGGALEGGGRANAGGKSDGAAGGSSTLPSSGGTSVVPASGGAAPTDAGSAASIDSGSASHATAGCGVAPLSSDTSIPVNGMTGSYILDLPTGYDNRRAYPLVMVFRGANVTVAAFRSYLNLEPVVGPDAIIVTPDCLNGGTTWDVQRDTPLVDALLTHLETAYCVDASRVFAVGHSAGGFFVSTLGCMRGTELRGIAPLSAGPPTGPCTGEFAVWISQGNQDTAFGLMNGRADRDFWVQRNACDASASTPVDPSPCVEYSGCTPGFAVRYCEYNGDLGLPSFAASGLWEFFKGL